jgi:predicted ferric reductase/Ca2+-binding EF-hand superfamily protein
MGRQHSSGGKKYHYRMEEILEANDMSASNEKFILNDIYTPPKVPSKSHGNNNLVHNPMMKSSKGTLRPPKSQTKKKANDFVSTDHVIQIGPGPYNGNSSSGPHLIKNKRQQQQQEHYRRRHGGSRRRLRPNVDAMLRSSVVNQRLSRISSTYSMYGGHDSIALLEDHNKYQVPRETITMLDSFHRKYDASPMEKLHALRDVLGSVSNQKGYIDRATFSTTFEMFHDEDNEVEDYHSLDGMIDGNAILIDAVMDLDVDVEEKLHFIFDTLDPKKNGLITRAQVVQLLHSNFSNANIEVIGIDFDQVVKLMFSKAGAKNENEINYDQFKYVFHSYISRSYEIHTNKKQAHTNFKSIDNATGKNTGIQMNFLSVLNRWRCFYETNHLRIWWLFFYFVANNIAFWTKWFLYEVDPAIGYGLRIARSCAQVIMLNFLLVLFPMCRSITQVMKRSKILWQYIPFDDHIEFHKICGITLLTFGLIHTGAHISNEIHLYLIATEEEINRSIFVTRHVFEKCPPFEQMILQLPIWTGILLLLISLISFPLAAIPKFRQGRFNLFWYSHMLFGPFLLIGIFHGANSWLARSQSYVWIIPPFLIYLIERRFRYGKIFVKPVKILKAIELDQTIAIFMEKPKRFLYRPGMYLYLNCPSISSHEWHPFTISSAPDDEYISLHMRKAGDWTSAFHQLILECHHTKQNSSQQQKYPIVYLDGPVGAPTQDYHRYQTVLCIAGGIGVTPFASILKDVVHLWEENRCQHCHHIRHPKSFRIQKIYFHWITRAQEALGWFEDTMNHITQMDKGNVIEAHQYLSTVQTNENTCQLKMFQQFVHEQTGKDFVSGLESKQLTHFGRPDWDKIFQQVKAKHPGEEIGVFFCGPHALDNILAEICRKYSTEGGTYFDYHSEKFA